jgi:outer membrane protein OmpA-like peptidoglycan-associated protein
MFGITAQRRKAGKDEAEKPFWISFSDLMTALMVLFLVAMAVALMAVTKGLVKIKQEGQAREETINSCMVDMQEIVTGDEFKGVVIRGYSIEFGTLAEFRNDDHRLDPGQEHFVRAFVPKVLEVARHDTCKQWLKRVVVEGFASQIGSYLYNLNLSFLRSQRILCVVLDSQAKDALSLEDRKLIRTLFLAGGSSFNTATKSPAQMRRVELKLEFRDLGTAKELVPDIPWDEDAKCPNDSR